MKSVSLPFLMGAFLAEVVYLLYMVVASPEHPAYSVALLGVAFLIFFMSLYDVFVKKEFLAVIPFSINASLLSVYILGFISLFLL